MEVSTEAPTHTIEREVMVIDPDGDLTVRTTDKDFRVCSSAMRRASPAMKAMLFGPWKEANRGPGPWIIDLPDDSSVAFEVILPIIHGASYTDYDLCKIEVHHIAHVVPVVQKYLMTPQLGPLINQWIMARQKHGWGLDHEDTLDDEYLDNLESAWNLGLTGAVSWCLAHLLYDGNTEDLDLLASARFFQERPHLLGRLKLTIQQGS